MKKNTSDDDEDEDKATISKKIKKADLSKSSKTAVKNETKERGKIVARARDRIGDQLNNQFGNEQTMQLV